MGSAEFSMLVLALFVGVAMAEVYHVGDSAGWTNTGHDYKAWSANIDFKVGDSIHFAYNSRFHNVVRVTHKDYGACNASSSPYDAYSSGNDLFNITHPGHYYFICGFPGHCQEGQKVDIRVPFPAPAPATPTPTPSPAPGSPPPSAPAPLTPSSPSPSPWSASSPAPSAPAPSPESGAATLAGNVLGIVVAIAVCVSVFAY